MSQPASPPANPPVFPPPPAGPQLVRVAETDRARVPFVLDGVAVEALAGDTLLTAILTRQRHLRDSEFGDGPRAGFCLIGACQDCWVRTEDGTRLRACSTPLREGMRVVTRAVWTAGGGDAMAAAPVGEVAASARPANPGNDGGAR
ncbi:(2Fe-2S)-binding protein [Burkholderia perseverans]|uniref:(2Fe-2S)-binding protein n=1 Tax=Burkholderia perseverans TaxID=2615214 RepID=UPI001FEE2AA0|nr:(2Fe-2S)-binding protein [Burkholderia perseverans]